MHILGAVLIIWSCIFLSLGFISRRRRHMELLSGLCTALELIKAELQTRLIPLADLCFILRNRLSGEAGEFFGELSSAMDTLLEQDFLSLWENSCRRRLSALRRDELYEIINLGAVLGRYELIEQLSAIDSCLLFLRSELNTARAEYPSEKKLCLGIGTAAALLTVLCLI